MPQDATPLYRLARSRLYLITGLHPTGMGFNEMVERSLEGGVDVVQLRDKDAETTALLDALEGLRKITERYGALLIVNDRVDIAVASGADGVHLGQSDLPVVEARRQLGGDVIVGLSTHSEQQFAEAAGEADYLAVGPIYATPTKPGRPAVGTGLVRFASSGASRPFFAIGGIDLANLASVLEAGATRVAVVRAIAHSHEPEVVARKMRKMLEGALA